jgi:23S rRNA G2445 N2-methylase RlmL
MPAKAPDRRRRRVVPPKPGRAVRPASAAHSSTEKGSPAYYALVVPGLEDIAASELRAAGAKTLGAITNIDKRDGIVLFSAKAPSAVMQCGTIEDVFQIVVDAPTGGGRGAPKRLARLLERDALERAMTAHHALRPGKRGRSYRVNVRLAGQHPFRRDEVEAAFSSALDGMLAKWVPARDKAALELWVHVIGDRTIAGVRLSDDTLAGRRYKRAHLPASLKPTVARALVLMAATQLGDVLVDPMSGAGTILREAMEQTRGLRLIGGDADADALEAARTNAGKEANLILWDALHLPLRSGVADIVVTNPPYGRQHETPHGVEKLYRALAREVARVLAPSGRCVILTGEPQALLEALPRHLRVRSRRRILLRGLPVTAFVIVRE